MEVLNEPASVRIRDSDCYPEVVQNCPNNYNEKYPSDIPQISSSFEEEEEDILTTASKPPLWKRKWLCAGVLLAVVAVAGLVGGLAGGAARKHTSNSAGNTVPATATIPQMAGSAKALASYAYPTAISWGAPHLEIYIPGKANGSNSVYRKSRFLGDTDTSYDPTGDDVEWVGGVMATYEFSVAAIARSVGNVDIFVTSTDQVVYHKYHYNNITWPTDPNTWENRGGNLTTAPSVVTWNEDRIDFFALGDPNGTLYQQTWTSSTPWSGYINLGGNWADFIPTVVTWGENRIDIFTIDPNTNELYHTFYDGTIWQLGQSLGGYCTSRPTAVSWGVGRLDVFVRGGDAGLWHLAYNGTWSTWSSISGNTSIQAEPEAVSWGADRIDVFAWGADSSLLHKSFDGNSWTPTDGFENLGTSLAGPPKAVSDAFGSLHVVSISTEETLQHLSYTKAGGAWSPGAGFDNLGTIPS